MKMVLDPANLDDYRLFIQAKALPRFRCRGREISFPDEYAHLLGMRIGNDGAMADYFSKPFLFDYQRDIARLAIRKRKFAVFAECGLGKSLIFMEYARHVASVLPAGKKILFISPLMVIEQTLEECQRWYGDELQIEQVRAKNLSAWLSGAGGRIGITNYDALDDDTPQGNLGCLILDESSMMKSAYGKWAQTCLRLGDGLDWKLCGTGTPAPNDRIEYANHAVFLGAFPTLNSFLARYFVNKGQTQERWVIKPHALDSFYRDLSHWCIFLNNPATYGWKDNTESIPPINVHVHDIDMTEAQRDAVYNLTGKLFLAGAGGITQRSKLSQIGKGRVNGERIATNKPEYIRELVASWPDESTIIWCRFNREQKDMEALFPEAASIAGETKYERRRELIGEFKRGERRILISKAEVLGLGLNLQIATRQVFSGLDDSYEDFHQAVKRSNRIGSTLPLNVHLPVTEVERPMIETVLEKAHRIEMDTQEQERIFKEKGLAQWN